MADRALTYTYLLASSVILGLLLLRIPFIGWILPIWVLMPQAKVVTGRGEVIGLTRGLIHLTQIPVATVQQISSVYAVVRAMPVRCARLCCQRAKSYPQVISPVFQLITAEIE